MKRKIYLITIFLLFPILCNQRIFAEEIEKFSNEIDLRTDGNIQVIESIHYDFGSEERHGIYRNIPLLKINEDGKKYRMVAKNVSVTDETQTPYKYTNTGNNEKISLKIGDPDKTVTGTHIYQIGYTLAGAITYFSDHDELYFNTTGTEWNIPIKVAEATINLPQTVEQKVVTVQCFTGPLKSTETLCDSVINGSIIHVTTTTPLNENEGLTIVVSFPKGIVAVNEPIPVFHLMDNPIIATIVNLFLVLVGLSWYILLPGYFAFRWWQRGRDPDATIGQAHVWFAPPKTMQKRDLTPGETGTLIDETVDPKDIAATIVDLARRRYITIVEGKKGLFQSIKFTLIKEKPPVGDHLEPFEKILLQEMFITEDSIETTDTHLYTAGKKASDALYEHLVTNKFFPENPEKIRNTYMIFALLGLITFNPLLFISGLIFGKNMPKKTEYGANQATIAKALKNFLVSQEHQFEFQAKNQILFEKMLPFAVAFGVEKIWAKRFEDITLKQPDWYQGNSFTNAVLLTDHLSSSIQSLNNSISPSRSSSGFSSGSGGFSGGGGGGGGGGSW